MPANSEKEHLSIVICGHVDSGKSTTTGRLIFELGGLPERELDKLKQEAERLGKGSFAFAFYMDRQKEERERGVTIACTTKAWLGGSLAAPLGGSGGVSVARESNRGMRNSVRYGIGLGLKGHSSNGGVGRRLRREAPPSSIIRGIASDDVLLVRLQTESSA